jgi:hypothetical protein
MDQSRSNMCDYSRPHTDSECSVLIYSLPIHLKSMRLNGRLLLLTFTLICISEILSLSPNQVDIATSLKVYGVLY